MNKNYYIGFGVVTVLAVGGYLIYRAVKKDKAAIDEQKQLTSSTSEPVAKITDNQGGGDGFVKETYSPIRSDFDKTWDYQLRDGVWYAKKKAGGSWVSLSLFPQAIKNLYSKYPKG